MGVGGGSSVLSADAAERQGLSVPALSEDLQAQIREFTPVAGTSVRNPLDTVGIRGRDQFLAAVRIVASSPDIHLLLIQSRIDWTPGTGQDSMECVAQGVEALEEAAKVGGKPVVAVIWPPTSAENMSRALAFQGSAKPNTRPLA
jgi:acyl-CoA synthetase (NDP forming)